MWWELGFVNAATGEERTERACGYSLMPKLLLEVIKASNRPTASLDKMATEVSKGFVGIIQHLGHNGKSPLLLPADLGE